MIIVLIATPLKVGLCIVGLGLLALAIGFIRFLLNPDSYK